MRLALLAGGLMVIVAVGIFIGLTGFQQYALDSSRSLAGSVVCAADRPFAAPGQSVLFTSSGLSAGSIPHWSASEGRSTLMPSGAFSVTYAMTGQKTVFMFFRVGDSWMSTTCGIEVR